MSAVSRLPDNDSDLALYNIMSNKERVFMGQPRSFSPTARGQLRAPPSRRAPDVLPTPEVAEAPEVILEEMLQPGTPIANVAANDSVFMALLQQRHQQAPSRVPSVVTCAPPDRLHTPVSSATRHRATSGVTTDHPIAAPVAAPLSHHPSPDRTPRSRESSVLSRSRPAAPSRTASVIGSRVWSPKMSTDHRFTIDPIADAAFPSAPTATATAVPMAAAPCRFFSPNTLEGLRAQAQAAPPRQEVHAPSAPKEQVPLAHTPTPPSHDEMLLSPAMGGPAGEDPEDAHTWQDIQLEKQAALLEIDRLRKQQGVKISRNFTMRDHLSDMQFEIRRHLTTIDEANMVKFMSDGMRLACTGIELANSKLGPFLELDGWAMDVTSDMTRYESALTKLYRKYWRRSSMSPEMELAFALVGSLAMHHFKRKTSDMFFGKGASPSKPKGKGFLNGLFKRRPPPSARGEPTDTTRSETTPASSHGGDAMPSVPSFDDDEMMPPAPAQTGIPDTTSAPSHTIPNSVPLSSRKRLRFPPPGA